MCVKKNGWTIAAAFEVVRVVYFFFTSADFLGQPTSGRNNLKEKSLETLIKTRIEKSIFAD